MFTLKVYGMEDNCGVRNPKCNFFIQAAASNMCLETAVLLRTSNQTVNNTRENITNSKH